MKQYIFLFLFFISASNGNAQSVGVGTATPDTSAQLEVYSQAKGFLPPRMTAAQRDSIKNPAAGLIIWCSDCNELQVFNGVIWTNSTGNVASNVSFLKVPVCSQVWMLKNLDVTTYNNGDSILHITDNKVWDTLTRGAWRWYDDDSAKYAAVYGRMYNWYAVNDARGIAPAGWHIPTETEYSTTLFNCAKQLSGSSSNFMGALREKGYAHWTKSQSPVNTTNATGFTALPGGVYYTTISSFSDIGFAAFIWSGTGSGSTARGCLVRNNSDLGTMYNGHKTDALSVRCLKN
ncbi:MAG: fibrobacter succinogenes major paralogous domain-containing protein [Ferruginibacter sp.]